MALHYIGGVLKQRAVAGRHLHPTTNSTSGWLPGFEAPVNLAYQLAQPERPPSASRCTRRARRPSDRVPLA